MLNKIIFNFCRSGRSGGQADRDGIDNENGPSYRGGGNSQRDQARSGGKWEDRNDGNSREWNGRSDSRRGGYADRFDVLFVQIVDNIFFVEYLPVHILNIDVLGADQFLLQSKTLYAF